MNNILAAKVLISHLPDITDGAYRTATKIAIESLFQDAITYYYTNLKETDISPKDYLGLTREQYDYWVFGTKGENDRFDEKQGEKNEKEFKK